MSPLPTPTQNNLLALKAGGFDSLAAALEYAAQGETGFNLYSAFGELSETLSYAALRHRAQVLAGALAELQLARGSYVGLIGQTSVDFFILFFACQYAGVVPCILPYNPQPSGKHSYITTLGQMLKACGAECVLAPEALAQWLRDADLAAVPIITLAPFSAQTAGRGTGALTADDMAYVQFSSGSTAEPKGVLLSQKAVMSNIDVILRNGMQINEHDRACSWLPLYHDMGLVGFFLAALCAQRSVDYLAPSSFAKRPALWLKLISKNRSTITYAPAFAYHLAMQRVADDEPLDLSSLRIAGIGGELIREHLVAATTCGLKRWGFAADAWLPSYGLAENCLAVAIGRPAMGIRLSSMPSADQTGRTLVSCGQVLPHNQVYLVDDQGLLVAERQIGRVLLKSPSLMQGYVKDGRLDRSGFLPDGFMDTGDLGYWEQGQLIISGRSKEMIQMRGRNLWPQDIEWALEQVPPLHAGDVAAFQVEQQQQEALVVLVQYRHRASPEACQSLQGELNRILTQRFGVQAQLQFLAPRTLPLTSSGKLSRSKAREAYLRGEYA